MKKTIIYSILTVALLVTSFTFVSCTKTSYSAELKEEKALIKEYIKRNNIEIIYEEPEDYTNWPKNQWLELGDYCYMHLNVPGDTATDTIAYKDNVNIRYRRYTLDVNADTLSYWNTNESPYPIEFQYNVSSPNACNAWHMAMRYMRFTGSEASVITPSKLGFQTDGSSVTPYVYDLKMQIIRF